MTIRILALAATAALALGTSAQAAEVRVLASNAMKTVLEELGPQFEKSSEHKLTLVFGTAAALKAEIEKGSAVDVALLTDGGVNDLVKQGKLASAAPLAGSGAGVAIKKGAAKPDLSSTEAFKKTLLNAKSIAHPDPKGGGFTGAHIDRMFERLSIADAVRPKVLLGYAFTGGVANIAKGVAEIGIFNISEIVPIKGVTLVGPLPAEFQNYLVFSGALHARGAAPGPAAAYLRSLTDPAVQEAWKAGGMEAVVPGQ